ncbi:MAG: tetrahydromethanopterin S-methyltransferase subunit F [Methanimicrococcus sp.]|nr:tetrahydromethanopterin S-methyltransferase subunit F [Methanimicrococcus sp.]
MNNQKSETKSRLAYMDSLVDSITYRSQLISRSQKLDSGLLSTRRIGFAAGFLTAVLFVIVIPFIFLAIIGII